LLKGGFVVQSRDVSLKPRGARLGYKKVKRKNMKFDFTVAVLSDTQNYCEKYPDIFHAQTRWIAENAGKEKIAFVTHVGDIVQNGARDMPEWDVATEAMNRLVGKVPFGVVAGNHDYDVVGDPKAVMETYRRRFGQELFSKVPTTRDFGPDDCSSAHIFRAAGREFLSLHLEHDPRDEALAWAQSVLYKYPTLPAILTTHTYLNDENDTRDRKPYLRTGGNSAEDLYQKLIRKNPRIFLVQCGHWWGRGGETTQVSTNDYGGRVTELLSDYQGRANGGNGWLRLLRFDLKGKMLHIQTYSPTLKQFETDLDSEMSLPLEIDRPIPASPVTLLK
jgi:predicted phosphodiesterase